MLGLCSCRPCPCPGSPSAAFCTACRAAALLEAFRSASCALALRRTGTHLRKPTSHQDSVVIVSMGNAFPPICAWEGRTVAICATQQAENAKLSTDQMQGPVVDGRAQKLAG